MILHLSGSFISLDEATISGEDEDGFVDVSGKLMDTADDGKLVIGDDVLSFEVHRRLVIIQRTE